MLPWAGFPAHVVSDACNSWGAWQDSKTRWTSTRGGGTSAAAPFAAGGAMTVLLEARRLLGDDRTGVRNGVVAQGRRGAVRSGPLADGKFTVVEWKRTVLATASERPTKQREDGPTCPPQENVERPTLPLLWKDVPKEYPEYLHIGYGAIDKQSRSKAIRVLKGLAAMPDRTDTDAYFAHDRQIREVTHEVFSKP